MGEPRFIPAKAKEKGPLADTEPEHNLFDAFYFDERNNIKRDLHPIKTFWNIFTTFNNFSGNDKAYDYNNARALTSSKFFVNPLATEATILSLSLSNLDKKVAKKMNIDEKALDKELKRELKENAEYFIYVPPGLSDAFKSKKSVKAKISLFFGVETEINSFGLRRYFYKSNDSVLITIPDQEWGNGITTQMISDVLDVAGLKGINFSVEIMAGYSAAYRGINLTVINKLVDLTKLKRLIYLDAFYFHDDFPLSAKTPVVQKIPTNTLWAIDTAFNESADAELFIYAYSLGGTERTTDDFRTGKPPPRPKVPIDDFLKKWSPNRMHFIDLEFDARIRDKLGNNKFESICLARLIENGINESFEDKDPKLTPSILALVNSLPERGSLGTWGRAGFIDLFSWVDKNPQKDAISRFPADKAFNLVKEFNLLGGWTRTTDPGSKTKKALINHGVPVKLIPGYALRHVDFVQEICKECLLP
jgi:hypothetical protein